MEEKKLFHITQQASKHIHHMIGQHSAYGVRIGVKKRGCSGLSYFMEYVSEPDPLGVKLILDDMNFFIEKTAVMHILGTTMDYIESDFKSGFEFYNPNEKSRCGCGESFTT